MLGFPVNVTGSGGGTPVESTGLQKPETQKARKPSATLKPCGGYRSAAAFGFTLVQKSLNSARSRNPMTWRADEYISVPA